MNNKILARVVAVVLSVMMLGTVAFAAPVLNDGFGGFTDAEYGDGAAYGTQKTMIAFWADSKDAPAPEDPEDILAIDQDSALELASVTFDTDKIPTSGWVIVVYGGDTGTPLRTELEVSSLPDATEGTKITATAKSIFAEDGVTFVRNAVEVTATLTAEAVPAEVGYKVNVAGRTKVNEFTKDLKGLTIEGGGSVSFSLLMVGVPTGTTMEFVPYIKY